MSPRLENYGTDDDLYVVIEDVRPGISLEVTEDDDTFWVSLKGDDGRLLGDASINPRSNRDTTYDKHRYSTADYPEPQDSGGSLHLGLDADRSADLPRTIHPGQYLTRVDSVTADDIAHSRSPQQFPTVDEARSFVGMYVLELPPEPVVDDEPPVDESEPAERVEPDSDSDVTVDETEALESASNSEASDADEQPIQELTLFDIETEQVFDVLVSRFTAHYGVTIWNTGQFWQE